MPAFSLTLGDGSVLTPGTLKPAGVPKVVGLAADPKASICSERVSGKAIEVPYVCPGKELALTWRAILREGSAYIRQEIVLLPGTGTLAVRKLTLIDMDAIFNVVLSTIRKVQPDTYISATVGTWPSPFWLRFADSIWRQGGDTGFAGQGNGRERWITYRDAMVFDRIVRRGPLYPLNALMNGGIIVGERGDPAKMERDEGSVRNEIRSFFGSGTSLQELYIAPHLLTPAMWDSLAESITWAKRNGDSLADVHWIGGDPQRLHVYGYASWTPGKGTVCLRNPSDQECAFTLDIGSALELPSGEPKAWRLRSPYKDQSVQELASEAGSPREIRLHPFEVLVFDCAPARRPLF